jgi:lipopolysaccharide export system protein LptC
MSKYSIFFTIIFLVIISIISFWLNNEVKKELNIEEKKLTNNPDYFLKNFISKQTDDLGNLNFSLKAIQMNYFSYSDESIFKKFEDKKKVLDLISNKGVIYENGEKIKMLDDAQMIRHETKSKKVMKLLSNEITIMPDKEILSSDQKIKIIQEPNIEIDGVGFDYNKKTGILKIYDSVKVHYDK